MKKLLIFSLKLTTVHVITYYIIGGIAYQLVTKEFYIGENPVFSTFMITENDAELWSQVMIWILPGQIIRGILISIVVFPFFETLISWRYLKRFFVIAGLYLVLGFWASTVAAPGTIDGIIYMRPEINLNAHLAVQPEIIIQGLLLSAWISKWMAPKKT